MVLEAFILIACEHTLITRNYRCLIELCIKSLEEGQNRGFDHSLREILIKGLLAHHVLEPILKVG